ncbi:MAG TPA: CPBP family intramembrane glutamic endopeptidase [Planctomycetota bacterium]|nr:CPBP family intramembrane glutamic endopeptidase [Planctomycetota bacterium]
MSEILSQEASALPPAIPPRAVARWRWWLHLALITAYVLAIGATAVFQEKGGPPALSSSTRGLLWASAESLLSFGAVFAVAWLASRATREELRLPWRGGLLPIPLGIVYSLGLRIAVGVAAVVVAVTLVLLQVVGREELQDLMQSSAPDFGGVVSLESMRENPTYFWLMLTLVSFVVAGLREELWRAAFLAGMRGLWPRRFASRKAELWAVAVAAVVFGFGHAAMGPLAVAAAFVLGFGLGAIMVFHRSIWPAVLAHGFFDATSFAVLPWAAEKLQEASRALGQ